MRQHSKTLARRGFLWRTLTTGKTPRFRTECNSSPNSSETLENPDNVTINAGAGDDYINNRGSKTIILGGDGKDVIFGFDNSDMLKITGTFFGTYNKSKKEVYFKVGSTVNAVTLKDFSATASR